MKPTGGLNQHNNACNSEIKILKRESNKKKKAKQKNTEHAPYI